MKAKRTQFKTNKNMVSESQVSWQTRVIPALGKKAEGQGTRVSMNLKAEEGSRYHSDVWRMQAANG